MSQAYENQDPIKLAEAAERDLAASGNQKGSDSTKVRVACLHPPTRDSVTAMN